MAAKALNHDLSEKAIDNLEVSIPQTAACATYAAYVRALAAGHTVLRVEGSNIVAASAEGVVRVVNKTKPRRKVTVGEVVKVRRLEASA